MTDRTAAIQSLARTRMVDENGMITREWLKAMSLETRDLLYLIGREAEREFQASPAQIQPDISLDSPPQSGSAENDARTSQALSGQMDGRLASRVTELELQAAQGQITGKPGDDAALLALMADRRDKQEAYPVGSVFLSTVTTNPNVLLGYGIWARVAEGQFLAGFKTGDADFGTLKGTGGSKTANLLHAHDYTEVVDHTHAVNITEVAHSHGQRVKSTGNDGTTGTRGGDSANDTTAGTTATASTGITATTSNPAGSVATGTTQSDLSATQSVLNPYFTVYAWERTA